MITSDSFSCGLVLFSGPRARTSEIEAYSFCQFEAPLSTKNKPQPSNTIYPSGCDIGYGDAIFIYKEVAER